MISWVTRTSGYFSAHPAVTSESSPAFGLEHGLAGVQGEDRRLPHGDGAQVAVVQGRFLEGEGHGGPGRLAAVDAHHDVRRVLRAVFGVAHDDDRAAGLCGDGDDQCSRR